MKNLLFHLKAVKTGTLKAEVGAGASSGAGYFLKVGAEKIVSAPQPWYFQLVLFPRARLPSPQYCGS
jgi:hypothetical protein